MVVTIHVYGFIKKIFDPNASMAENTVIKVDYVKDETFIDFLKRISLNKLDLDEVGDCFINSVVVIDETMKMVDNSRVALFGKGMRLLCGGQHLKGHGMVEKKPTKPVNYF